MAKFPEPPDVATLRSIKPELAVLAAGTEVWRVYFQGGAHPMRWSDFRYFGPTGSRFDHQPEPQQVHADRGIMYAAEQGPTCIAEVFQQTRTIDRAHASPWLVCFALARDVTVLDMTQAWPTRAGASMNIHSGIRARARRWSQVIYEAYPQAEGLRYASSMDANLPALALYERSLTAVPATVRFHRALADPTMLDDLRDAAARFGYALV